jgi:hypothetical protein
MKVIAGGAWPGTRLSPAVPTYFGLADQSAQSDVRVDATLASYSGLEFTGKLYQPPGSVVPRAGPDESTQENIMVTRTSDAQRLLLPLPRRANQPTMETPAGVSRDDGGSVEGQSHARG